MTTRDFLAQTFTIISGDEINMTVKKGSTRVDTSPKRKHIHTLTQYINNPRANFIHLIDCLSLRFRKKHWMVSLKALLMTHYLMNQNNPNFMSQLSKRANIFEIAGYIDNSSTFSVDMSPRVTKYAKVLSIKNEIYRIYQRDISIKSPKDESLDTNNIKQIFQQVEHLEKLQTSIFENDVDFSVPSPIIHSIHIVLLKEYLRIYTAHNSRMIFLLQNLSDMEASEAIRVIPHYKALCETHKKIEILLESAKKKGIEGISDIRLSEPSRELMTSIEDFIKDIIKIRGTPRLQKEWHITPAEVCGNLTNRSGELVDFSKMENNIIPNNLIQDLYDVFSSEQSLATRDRSQSLNEYTSSNNPIIQDPSEKNVQKPIDFTAKPMITMSSKFSRAVTFDESAISSALATNRTHNPEFILENDKTESLTQTIDELDRLIFENMKIESVFGAPPVSHSMSANKRSTLNQENYNLKNNPISSDSQHSERFQESKNLKNPFL